MISLSEVGGLYLSTPANIKNARTKAFMYACDRQIKKLLERAEKAKVWCAIESVDEKYLDYMAADCRALFYNSSLAPDVKRKLIANSQYWYMKLGTLAAMEEMLNIVFQCTEAKIEEWYDYSGDAFRFRVAVPQITDMEISEFFKYINEVKNARSIFDGLILRRIEKTKIYVGIAKEEFVKEHKGINPYNKVVCQKTGIHIGHQSCRHIIVSYKAKI